MMVPSFFLSILSLLSIWQIVPSSTKPMFGINWYHRLFGDYDPYPIVEEPDHPLSLRHRSGYHQHADGQVNDGRIVGGYSIYRDEAPYQLSLQKERTHFCGATLVESPGGLQFAVTAAHCVIDKDTGKALSPNVLSVRGGSTSKYAGQSLEVRKVVPHPKYEKYFSDIALVFFKGSFELSRDLQPIGLPQDRMGDTTDKLYVSGWGALREKGKSPTQLQLVSLPVISNTKCADQYAKYFSQRKVIEQTVICAGYDKGGKDACQGDSGGPAIGEDEHGRYLAGVVSWGKGCARKATPGVFTRVSSYINWIMSVVDQDENEDQTHYSRKSG